MAEGPAWNGVGRYLLWSDIPNNVQLRWLEEDGHVTTFRRPSGNSNGNTFDWEGRQIACEHGNRRVVRYEYDGSVTVPADTWQGTPLNAPNDAVVHPDDGGIWFTDPGYGSLMNYEGNKGKLHLKEAVYRIDAKTGKMDIVTDDLFKPNGLCFSPDYKKLYIAETGASHYEEAPRNIKVWTSWTGRNLRTGTSLRPWNWTAKRFCRRNPRRHRRQCLGQRRLGGRRLRRCGTSSPPRATASGRFDCRKSASNVFFGGTKRNRLFMTASQSLYAVYVETQGAHIT